MPRYQHQLTKRERRSWPYRVLCVDTTEIDQSEVNHKGRHKPQLLDWHMVALVNVKGDYEYRPVENSGTAEDYWRIVESYSLQHKQLVIASWNTSLVWTLLGLWERLESGELWLTPREWESTDTTTWAISILSQGVESRRTSYGAGRIKRLVDAATGYLVLSGSPLIAKVHVRSSPNWVKWIDLSNYGVARPKDVSAGPRTCDWIADTFCRLRRLDNGLARSGWAATAGGLAEQVWRHGYYQGAASVTVHHGASACETAAYYGGRAEAFYLGSCIDTVWYLDIRNCYAHCCTRAAVPVRLRRQLSTDGRAPSGGTKSCSAWTATVTIKTDVPLYPYRCGELTIWPIGRFTTTLCGPELSLANERGHIVAWHEAYEYDCEYALRDYALALYDARCLSDNLCDKEISDACKMMLNCLVGRLAQRDTNWHAARDIDCDVLWGEYDRLDENGMLCRYRSLGGRIQRLVDNGYMPDAMPAMAGWITSAARVYLAALLECAGWENTVYVDTDALMVRRAGYDRLMDGGYIRDSTIGYLGRRWRSSSLVINGIKHYVHDGIPVCAGVPEGAYNELLGSAMYRHQRLPTEDLRSRQRPESDTVLRSIILSDRYSHGVVLPDGAIRPHIIGGT